MKILDDSKARALNPFHRGEYDPPIYVKSGTEVTIELESRDQMTAVLAAHDYGLDCLTAEGKRQIERLLADIKFKMEGR